jgi:hypothetical protein
MPSAYQLALDQSRSVREILVATVRVYRRYPLLFAILALAVIAPYKLAVLAATGYGPLRSHENAGVSWLLLLADSALITPLVSALHVHAVVAIGEGQRPRLRAVALRGLQVLPVVAAADVITSLGIGLGFVALIIPGILLWLRWAVVAQAAALEHEGWLPAMRSSTRLTAGYYWHVLGLLLVTAVPLTGAFIGARAIPLGSTSGVASVTVGIAIDTAAASVYALTLALLYFDLRARARQPAGAPREHRHLRDLD